MFTSLFYVTGEFYRFLHRSRARFLGHLLRSFAFYFVLLKNFNTYFCNAVVIASDILQFTQAQVYVFVLAAFVSINLTFTSLVIVVELCTLLCYEEIVLKFRNESFNLRLILSAILFVRAQTVGAVNHFQLHPFAPNYTFTFLH